MNWNDYEAAWKRQPAPLGLAADLTELKDSFESRRRKLAATLLLRDWAEAAAGLLVAIVLGLVWATMGASAWPLGLAILLLLGVSSLFVRERRRTRRLRLGEEAPLLTKVEADLAELRHQRRLLSRIWLWYLGPILIAVLIGHFTLTGLAPAWSPQRDPVFSAGFVAFYLFCLGIVWWLNRHASRTQLEPRIAELEKLRADLAG